MFILFIFYTVVKVYIVYNMLFALITICFLVIFLGSNAGFLSDIVI